MSTKQRILDEALTLFAEKGYDGTGVDLIAERVGIKGPSLYKHYKGNHICFFFVDGSYHRKGVGTRMFCYLMKDYNGKTITVNSSPYGVPFYKAIGFNSRE